MAFGFLEFCIICFVFGTNILWVVALVSAANFDREVWERVGRDKQSWILLIVFFSGLAALIYMLSVRRQLMQASVDA